MTVRDRMNEQAPPEPEEVAPEAIESDTPENTEPSAEETAEEPAVQDEDAEPDEESFENPAEYKAALKEHASKQTEKRLKAEYEHKLEGLYRDLRKQRGSKRDLREEISTLKTSLEAINAKLNGNGQDLREPTPEEYGHNPEAYAKAKSAYDLLQWQKGQEAKRNEEATRQQTTATTQQEWSYKMQAGMTRYPNLPQLVDKINKEEIGKHIKPQALAAMQQSPIGVDIYVHLAENPDVAEDIEDLDPSQQVMAIRQLESQLFGQAFNRTGQAPATPGNAAPPKAAPTKPVVTNVQQAPVAPKKAAPAPPPKATGSATSSGGSRGPHSSMSTEEWIRSRNNLKKQGKW